MLEVAVFCARALGWSMAVWKLGLWRASCMKLGFLDHPNMLVIFYTPSYCYFSDSQNNVSL